MSGYLAVAFTNTVGTGNIFPGNAVGNSNPFSSLSPGSVFTYTIIDPVANQPQNQYEIGSGVWNGTYITRSVLESSNNGNLIYMSGYGTTVYADNPPSGGATTVTVGVGSTTTVSAGTPASVTNSGNSVNVVLNFDIPSGNTGATGATGATGPTGPQGSTTGVGSNGQVEYISNNVIAGTSSATVDSSGLISINNYRLQNFNPISGSLTFDCANGNVLVAVLSGNVTITAANIPNAGYYTIAIYGNTFSPSWSASFYWPSGVTPVQTGGWDIYSFVSFYNVLMGSHLPNMNP